MRCLVMAVALLAAGPAHATCAADPRPGPECSLDDLLGWLGERIAAHGEVPALAGLDAWIGKARWGEQHDNHGVTLRSAERLVTGLVRAQEAGLPFGDELLALSLHLAARADALHAALGEDTHPARATQADEHRQRLVARVADEAYAAHLRAPGRPSQALAMWQDAWLAHVRRMEAVSACTRDYNDFRLPGIQDPVAQARAATPLLAQLLDEWRAVSSEIAAAAGDPAAPGRELSLATRDALDAALEVLGRPLDDFGWLVAAQRELFESELGVFAVLNQLDRAAADGAFVAPWQACLGLGLLLRAEILRVRVEFVCGRGTPVSQHLTALLWRARNARDTSGSDALIDLLLDPATRCSLIATYNDCIARNLPDEAQPVPYLPECAGRLP